MSTFLLVLGREPKLSLAELEALFGGANVKQISHNLAQVEAQEIPLDRLGGSIKAGRVVDAVTQGYYRALDI